MSDKNTDRTKIKSPSLALDHINVSHTIDLDFVEIWESRTARNLFSMTKGTDVKKEVARLSSVLKGAMSRNDCMVKLLQQGATIEDLNDLGEDHIMRLRKRCMYLGKAYRIAEQKYGW
jgi:hypothetical protein